MEKHLLGEKSDVWSTGDNGVPVKEENCRFHFESRHKFYLRRLNEIRATQWLLAECIAEGHNFATKHETGDIKILHCQRCGFNYTERKQEVGG